MTMKRKAIILFNLVIGISLFCAVTTVSAKGGPDFCRKTSSYVLTSCQQGAQSDYSLALANCQNLSDPKEQKDCQQQAKADYNDARQTCRDQYNARQEVCDRLGGAPYDPVIDPANFVAKIDNLYFPLKPGTTFIYEGQTAEGFEHEEFFVTNNTKVILGVTCIEVRDRSWVGNTQTDDTLTEDTLDWFAQDTDGNVWYFGENAKQYAAGMIVGIEGSWTAGVDDAKPGIVMKAAPAIGDFYRQEFALDTAEDMAEVISLTEFVTVPAGSFGNCLETLETSPMEPDAKEHKFYAPNKGQVLTVDLVTGDRLELKQIVP
jgi:hypothetical protein